MTWHRVEPPKAFLQAFLSSCSYVTDRSRTQLMLEFKVGHLPSQSSSRGSIWKYGSRLWIMICSTYLWRSIIVNLWKGSRIPITRKGSYVVFLSFSTLLSTFSKTKSLTLYSWGCLFWFLQWSSCKVYLVQRFYIAPQFLIESTCITISWP